MMKRSALAVLLFGVGTTNAAANIRGPASAASIKVPDLHRDEFAAYVTAFAKPYASDEIEYEHRYGVFVANKQRVADIQANERGSARYGMNELADLSAEEFRAQRLGAMPPIAGAEAMTEAEFQGAIAKSCLQNGAHAPAPANPAAPLPDSFDWRDKNAVTDVRNQGGCGSCWAHSASETIESHWFLAGNDLTSLSPQEIVDCSHDCSNVTVHGSSQTVCNAGCQGGWPWAAFLSVTNWGGLGAEADYPYTGRDGTCSGNTTKPVARISNYTCYTADEPQLQQALVLNGPISIALNAEWMQFYLGGISNPELCDSKSLDHAIQIVGYGVADTLLHKGEPYWLIRNSWGPHWGEKGYIRLHRGDNTCGVANAASSPVV